MTYPCILLGHSIAQHKIDERRNVSCLCLLISKSKKYDHTKLIPWRYSSVGDDRLHALENV